MLYLKNTSICVDVFGASEVTWKKTLKNQGCSLEDLFENDEVLDMMIKCIGHD